MNSDILGAIVVAGLVLAGLGLAAFWRWNSQRQRAALQAQFGPEYHRTVQELGDQRHAEADLQARQQRVARLAIQPLQPEERDRFATQWRAVQSHFVDDPQGAIQEADALVSQVMGVRGYPLADFEQRAADVSVDHPQVVEHYRAAHRALPDRAKREGTTEELRQALVHYRALFEVLLETEETDAPARQVA